MIGSNEISELMQKMRCAGSFVAAPSGHRYCARTHALPLADPASAPTLNMRRVRLGPRGFTCLGIRGGQPGRQYARNQLFRGGR